MRDVDQRQEKFREATTEVIKCIRCDGNTSRHRVSQSTYFPRIENVPRDPGFCEELYIA